MRSTPAALAALSLTALLALGACSSDDDTSSATDPPAAETATGDVDDADVTDALEAAAPDGEVEVPSEDGATTIAEYAAGSSSYEPADPAELAQILALVGTDADGYLTADAVVVRGTDADSALWCGAAERLSIDTYRIVPVRPDGTGVAC